MNLMAPFFPVSDVTLLGLTCVVNETDLFAVPGFARAGVILAEPVAALASSLVVLALRCVGTGSTCPVRECGFDSDGEGLAGLGLVADFRFGVVVARFSAVLAD